MAWEHLSTLEQLKKNLPILKDTDISDSDLTGSIVDADEVIYDDLSKYVDWDEVEALTVVPRVINRLSQYQTVLILIVRQFHNDETMLDAGGVEEEKNSVYSYYHERYKNLMEQIETGAIKLLDDDNEELAPDVARAPGLGRVI